jgi:hypothetical protein
MPVRVADIDLRVPCDGMGLEDHVVRIVRIGILPVAFRAEELDRGAIARYANGEMDVACVERLLTKCGMTVNDQMQLPRIAELKPGDRKSERRPGDLSERQDLPVELSRPLHVGDGEGNVVKGGGFHTGYVVSARVRSPLAARCGGIDRQRDVHAEGRLQAGGQAGPANGSGLHRLLFVGALVPR